MNLFNRFEAEFQSIFSRLCEAGELPAKLDSSKVVVEIPRDASHGDLACNAAMVMAGQIGARPRDLAERLAREIGAFDGVRGVEVAGPGFLNLRIENRLWSDEVDAIVKAGDEYGRNDAGKGRNVNVEYVSANPTGPLHAAHARGAILGDALAALLEFSGWNVTREYYVNDAGSQVDVLARSAHLRYREALGHKIDAIPQGMYPGEYLKEVGAALAGEAGDKYLDADESEWIAPVREFAIASIIAGIKDDLAALGVKMDRYTSERELVARGAVEDAIKTLGDAGHVYRGVLEAPKGKEPEDWEPREQLLFRATAFGDDTDRPLQKSDDTWTYFASDVANHLDKLRRTDGPLVNIFGADHGGYVKRMKAAVKALSGRDAMLDIKLCQLVRLLKDGEPVKMSKRAGTFVTLRDVIDAVGADVMRFIMLTRRSDQTLDFDFAKVTEQSRDNPVFYVQYAHARASSVLGQAGALMRGGAPCDNKGSGGNSGGSDGDNKDGGKGGGDAPGLTDTHELALVKQLAGWPRTVRAAAESNEPHRIAFYLMEVAACFHGLWTAGRENPELRFIREDAPELTAARLKLVQATALVIRLGLGILSIEPAEKM